MNGPVVPVGGPADLRVTVVRRIPGAPYGFRDLVQPDRAIVRGVAPRDLHLCTVRPGDGALVYEAALALGDAVALAHDVLAGNRWAADAPDTGRRLAAAVLMLAPGCAR